MITDEIKVTDFELQIFVFSYTAMLDKQKTLSDVQICYI